jgi:hypothetical protein
MKSISIIFSRVREAWSMREEPERFAELTRIYWVALLLVAAVLISLIFGYGAYRFYTTLTSDPAASVQGGGAGMTLNTKDLETTLDGFQKRAEAYEAQKRTPPQLTDPSR